MILSIFSLTQQYDLNFERITQLCGTSFRKKQYILDSLKKHFSSSHYSAYEEALIDNVRLDGEVPGREYFEVHAIEGRSCLLNAFRFRRDAMMSEYLEQSLQEFSFQTEMDNLRNVVDAIHNKLNQRIAECFTGIEMEYQPEKLFNIVQKSEVSAEASAPLETLPTEVLLRNYLALIEEIQKRFPRRMMIIFENLDHLIDEREYHKFFDEAKRICEHFNVWILISVSTECYVHIDPWYVEGINIINDEIFSLPSLERIQSFVENNYPYFKSFSEKELFAVLRPVIHKIGKEKAVISQRSDVLLKMINRSLCLDTRVVHTINKIEKNYLDEG